ncbi:MAG: hypothetical protein JO078_08365 [Candidatus Eremiobacteraeota bacterium]|nr:hypothetical protein [Candidatus Eremiobacteraeota bacterium]MBV9700125.1 hypothetical protein [Candidatus Eremiobacteraeota bacterium]
MGPVGSRQPPEAPPGREPPQRSPDRRRWALAIILVSLAALCAIIGWAQWYAVHVNVPKYQHRAPPLP